MYAQWPRMNTLSNLFNKAGLLNVLGQMNTVGDWERLAGITDRHAFWAPYAQNQDAGFAEIERRAVANLAALKDGTARLVNAAA